MRAPWYPEGRSKIDIDPLFAFLHGNQHGGGHPGFERYLDALNQRGDAPGFTVMRYVRPVGPLEHEVEVPGCGDVVRARIPSAAGAVAFSPGQMVSVATLRTVGAVILGRPPGGLIGSSQFAVESVSGGAFDHAELVSCAPASINAGDEDVELTLTGAGFSEDPVDVFSAALFDDDESSATFGSWLTDPYVTLHDPTWVDEQTVTVLADAAANTPGSEAAPYFFAVVLRRA